MAEEKCNLYRNHSVQLVTKSELRDVAQKLDIAATEEELDAYHTIIGGMSKEYDRVTELSETVGDLPPVKYPRTPGRKPRPEENPYKAWVYKTNITGPSGGKLTGKTVALKDNIAVAGVPLGVGSHLLDTHVSKYDAAVVTLLLDAGATVAGKAACEDFCLSGCSYFSSHGAVLNPHDMTRTAGGSSGGCAVLVQTEEVDMAVGADQGGSIRIPASWCGIVGLKPTFGLIPYTGACSVEPTVDHLGPMTRTAKDCALMLEVMAQFDPMDPRQKCDSKKAWDFTSQLGQNIKGKRIGLLKEGFDVCTNEVKDFIYKAAGMMQSTLGINTEEVSLPAHHDGSAIFCGAAFAGAYNTMVDSSLLSPGLGGFHDVDLHTHVHNAQKSRRTEWSPMLKFLAIHGTCMKEHYGNKFYGKSQNLVPWLTSEYDKLLQKYDALLMPTLPHLPPKIPADGSSTLEILGPTLTMTANTAPFDLTGHPALTINAGYTEGLPVGMQLVGRKHDEATLLSIAHQFERYVGTQKA